MYFEIALKLGSIANQLTQYTVLSPDGLRIPIYHCKPQQKNFKIRDDVKI